VDDSEYAQIVLEHAFDQAARHEAVDLHVVTVVASAGDLAAALARTTEQMREALDKFGAASSRWRVRAHVRSGDVTDEIVMLAAEVKADMLVVGRYGMHRWRGSFADEIVRESPCATLVIGLPGRDITEVVQCRDCVIARESSDGIRWFCHAHSAPDRLRLSELVPPLTRATSGVW
jgi:nucleotide-binding universal stress UspA family protein